MPKTTDRLEEMADILAGNVSGWETSTLERIGRRINHRGKMSLADIKTLNNIADVKQDMDAITRELAKVTGYNISELQAMYGEVIAEQHEANRKLYDYRGKKFVPFAENRELQSLVRAYAKTTGGTMINLAKTSALCIMDKYGKTVGLQKYYTDVLDKAVMQVSSGALDFYSAMRDTIKELGGSGIRVDYGGGITRGIESVVRQNLLWGAKQASVKYNEMIGEELGCDGIEIDWHSYPRPTHEFMQGKQYVLGKSRTINGVTYDSADRALAHLKDFGCLHFKTPIICGISEPTYSPEQLKELNARNRRTFEINGKEVTGYEASQMMRRLESGVRNEKNTRNLARASGDALQVRRSNAKIAAYKRKYEDISEITGIPQDTRRMAVTRGKNSGNVLQNGGDSGIIKADKKLPRITQISASTITRKIENGEYGTKLSSQQYSKHIEGTAQYKSYLESRIAKNGNPQSVLIISEDEAQQIILDKSGTGIVRVDRKGNPKPQEDITCDRIIGKYYGGGSYHETNKATIHYGKKSAHIVPIKGDNYD